MTKQTTFNNRPTLSEIGKKDAIRKLIFDSANKALSKDQLTLAMEFFDIASESEIYSELWSINLTHDDCVYGHIEFEDGIGYETFFSLPGCSISIEGFSLTKELELVIRKRVSVGFNTNSDVDKFEGHDYIAPSVNCTEPSYERFKVQDVMDIFDAIDEVCQRTVRGQVEAIKDLDGKVFGNGESIDIMREVLKRFLNEESIGYGFFKSYR